MPLRTRHAQRAGPKRSMMHNEKPCRRATGRASEIDEQGGVINFHHSRKTEERQALHVMRHARVSPAVARSIAALAFENRRAWR